MVGGKGCLGLNNQNAKSVQRNNFFSKRLFVCLFLINMPLVRMKLGEIPDCHRIPVAALLVYVCLKPRERIKNFLKNDRKA